MPKKDPVGKKIAILRREGKPKDQAVAMALNMRREGRLTENGGYMRKNPKKFGELAPASYAPK